MALKTEEFVPWTEATCALCGISYNAAKWPYQIQGVNICAGCNSRVAPVVHYVRFVRYLASKDCDNGMWQDGVYCCRLDCKCIPCQARKVVRVHETFMAKRGSLHGR